MGLLLRGCFLCQQKLFKQEIISLKRMVAHSVYNNNIKKLSPTLQARLFSSKKDKDSDRELIYNGSLSKKIRYLKIFSLSSTLVSLSLQPMVYAKLIMEDNIAHIAAIFVFINFACLCSPVFVHLFTKRYAINIYHNLKDGNYIAIVYTFFAKKKEIVFNVEDIQVNHIRAIFTNCTVKGMPLMFEENSFLHPKYYYNIMGQKKLEDFEVEELIVHSINQPQVIHKHHQIENKRQIEQ